MSSTCSDTLMSANKRSPWRLVRVILGLMCLLAAAGYGALLLPPLVRQAADDQRQLDLSLVAPSVEGVESLLTVYEHDTRPLADAITPLFANDDSVAYVRLWSIDSQILCSLTRHTGGLPAENGTVLLGETGATLALARAKELSHATPDFSRQVGRAQELARQENEVSDQVGRLVDDGRTDAAARGGIYSLQKDALDLAEPLAADFPDLADAVGEMKDALDKLSMEDMDSLQAAQHAVESAAGDVSLVLEDFRAIPEDTITLPPVLMDQAPPPANWGGRVWTAVHGRRTVLPLFLPAANDDLVEPAGFVEVAFYARPGEIIAAPGWRWWPVPALLLAAVLLMLPWRRRKPVVVEETTDAAE